MTDESFCFLSHQLPYLVTEVLLSHLDIFDLKALRQVSKSTKLWIETPEIILQFPVVINGENRMHEIISSESQVPWSNFVFSKKYKCVTDAEIKKYLAKFGDHIRILEFNWPMEKMQYEFRILSGCPWLQSLKSNQLNFETILPRVLTQKLSGTWRNLKHFHVQRFRGGSESPLTEMQFFEQILENCDDLQSLTIPQFSHDYQPNKGFDYEESFMLHVVSPLLKYIRTGRLQSITVPYYGLTDEIFLQLARACSETNTVLLNVRSAFLKGLCNDDLDILDIIGSLDGITDTIIRSPLPNLQSICFVNPSFNIENYVYPVPLFPKLVSVEIDFKFSKKSQKSMELFVHRLGKIRRPTVKSLRITYQPGPTVLFPINIGPTDLVKSFVNLRVLHIKDWEGEDEQFLQLWELTKNNVVDLSLANCRNLTDRGLLGDNPMNAAILKLKYLRKLSIINYLYVDQGEASITEMSFIHAFRHMRLKSFHYFDGRLLLTEKSIPLTAIEALWNGTFGSTIEDLVLQETDLENCDMILRKKLGSGSGKRGNHKRKYNDHLFRSTSLGYGRSIGKEYNQQQNSNCSIT